MSQGSVRLDPRVEQLITAKPFGGGFGSQQLPGSASNADQFDRECH
jgi:hypothetical protein